MKLMLKLKIDDVVNAAPVHGFCGAWGVICASLFATPHLYDMAYYSSRTELCKGLFYGGGTQFGANFVFGFAKCEGLGLCQAVGHEEFVMVADVMRGLGKSDEVAGDQLGSLMNQLVVGVLSVGSWLAPDHRAGLVVVNGPAFPIC